MRSYYLDNAATTAVSSEVFRAMEPYFLKFYGNASEPHQWGQAGRKGVDEAREKIGAFFGAKPREIIFTSCATESINFSHKGLIEAICETKYGIRKPHIITSSIEHKAVSETCRHLERSGLATVTYLPVDKYGIVNISDVENAIRPETVLVSMIYVNNEVGTIEPVSEIGKLVKRINVSRIAAHLSPIYFHTDATQAIQYLDCNIDRLGVDLLSFTGHKFSAPKGIGGLYVRPGTPLVRQQDGGGQEYRLRAGTENVPYIVGLGRAIGLVAENQKNKAEKTEKLRDELITGALKISGVKLTGHPRKRVPHIASFVVKGAEGEAMLLLLSEKGIAASSGSACTSGILAPSHVLLAMGVSKELIHGSIRFSLGKDTTKQEIDYTIKVLPEVISRLQRIAPKL